MAKTEKSKAELYREERKERISAAAKKNAKKSRKHPNAGKVAGRVIGIVLIVAIAAAVAFFALDSAGVFARTQTAFTIGKDKVSVAEYGYMYYMQYQNTANQAQQSESQYGYNMYGFDYTKSPEEQDSPYTNEDGTAIKWSEQLETNTVEYMQEFYSLYNNAIAEGYKTTEEDQKDIDENIESMRADAAGANSTQENRISMSLNSFLKLSYGKGINESFLRKLMEKELIVQRFSEDKQNSFNDKYSDEVVDAEYKKDTTAYDAVDLRVYNFEPEELTAKEGESEEALAKRQEAENAKALEKANNLLKEAKDEASFTKAAEVYIHEAEAAEPETEEAVTTTEEAAPAEDAAAEEAAPAEEAEEEHNHDSATKAYGVAKSSLNSSISEEAAKWAFDKSRKAGDKKAFANEQGVAYALYVVKTAYPQECVDVRHILFMTVDSSTGEALSDEEIAQKKASCDEVFAQWNDAADKTEDYFAELATQYSEDTGSASEGGLCDNVLPAQTVDEFDKWIFDDARKEGDVDVIESEYGYHIMYYVGNRDLNYRNSIRTSHTQEDYSSWLEGELEKAPVAKNAAGMAKGYDRAYKLINATVANINASMAQ